MLLAIDTSTAETSVALYAQQGVLAERSWRSSRQHSEQVLGAIDHLVRDLSLGPQDIQAVAVALGPGSWSGLRVGMGLAKGLALARQLPLIGVSSLEVLAYPHQRVGRPVFPIIKLGRDRYAMMEYRLRRSWSAVGEPQNVSFDMLVGMLPELALVCGDIDEQLETALRQIRGEGLMMASPALNMRRAGYLAEIAWQRHSRGAYDDLVTLEPIYLGHPVKQQ